MEHLAFPQAFQLDILPALASLVIPLSSGSIEQVKLVAERETFADFHSDAVEAAAVADVETFVGVDLAVEVTETVPCRDFHSAALGIACQVACWFAWEARNPVDSSLADPVDRSSSSAVAEDVDQTG